MDSEFTEIAHRKIKPSGFFFAEYHRMRKVGKSDHGGESVSRVHIRSKDPMAEGSVVGTGQDPGVCLVWELSPRCAYGIGERKDGGDMSYSGRNLQALWG